MGFWTFKNYLSGNGENVIREWLHSLQKNARIKIDRRIRYLENVQYFHKEPQYIKALAGYEGIFEIRVVLQNIQYRPLGCYGPDRAQFTLLVGAVERGSRFEPRDAPELALQRKEIIHLYRSRTCDHFD